MLKFTLMGGMLNIQLHNSFATKAFICSLSFYDGFSNLPLLCLQAKARELIENYRQEG